MLSLCSLRGAADAAQPFQPEWFFWADRQGASVGGKRPDCIQLARNMQSRRTNTSQNPGSKTIREFRKPVFVINEWLQLVHFSSFKTGLTAIRVLRLDPEELSEITSDEDVSSLSAS